MSRHIDIELTSKAGDGSWTWRAAGARQPKGPVEAALGPAGETVGAVLRADVEIGLEGIEILSLTSAKPTRSPEKTEGRIEVRGTPRRAPDVSVILAPGSDKRRRDDDGERRDRRGARRGPEREGRRDERGGDRPAQGGGGPRRAGGGGPPRRAHVHGPPQRHAGGAPPRADSRGRAAPARRPASRPAGHRGA